MLRAFLFFLLLFLFSVSMTSWAQYYQGERKKSLTNSAYTPRAVRQDAPSRAVVEPARTATMANLQVLFKRIQRLESEIRSLRDTIERNEQALETIREVQINRYKDIDQRLTAILKKGALSATQLDVADDPEAALYKKAHGLMKVQQFSSALEALRSYAKRYPSGNFIAQTRYWLGELYLLANPSQLDQAQKEFIYILSKHPNHEKIPDAMYKLAKIYHLQGNKEQAKILLQDIVSKFVRIHPRAVAQARTFLSEHY